MKNVSSFYKYKQFNYFVLCFVFFLFLYMFQTQSFADQGKPIEIRFSGASFIYVEDFLNNSDFIMSNYSTGIDIVWRGKYYGGTVLQLDPPIVTYSGGGAKVVYNSGNGSCNSTFSYNSDLPYYPTINSVENGVVNMSIPLPHYARNIQSAASLMDENALFPGKCRTASASLVSGSSVVADGYYTPATTGPSDDTFLGQMDYRLRNAYVEFNEKSPNYVGAFTYNYSGSIIINNFTQQTNKNVWFAQISVVSTKQNGIPTPINPFELFNYSVPNEGQTPDDAPIIAVPPDQKIKKWIKGLNIVEDIIRDVELALSGNSSVINLDTANNIGITFDDESGFVYIPSSVVSSAPKSGTLQIQIIVKPKNKSKYFKPKFSKKTPLNSVIAGESPQLAFKLKNGAVKLLKANKNVKVFVNAKFIPSGESKSTNYKFNFLIKF